MATIRIQNIYFKAAAGNNMQFLEFLKLFTIKNAIMLFGKAWESVPSSAMTGVWSKLLKIRKMINQKL